MLSSRPRKLRRDFRSALPLVIFLGSFFLCRVAVAEQSPSSETETQWVVVELRSGTLISGSLLGENEQELRILAGTEELTVPLAEVLQRIDGRLGTSPPAAPPPQPQGAPAPPPRGRTSSSWDHPSDSSTSWAGRKSVFAYERARLQLVDRRGFWLGPPEQGYPEADLGRENAKPFSVVHPGPEARAIKASTLTRLLDSETLQRGFQKRRDDANTRLGLGYVFLGVGTGLLQAAAAILTTATTDWSLDGGIALPFLWSGIPFVALGGTFHMQGVVRTIKLSKQRELSRIWDRDEVWEAVEKHNKALREEYGLPPDAPLDRPELQPHRGSRGR